MKNPARMNRSRAIRVSVRTGHALTAGWLVFLAIIGLWVFHRLGGFDLWSTFTRPDGTTVRFAKTFGGIDHPFHATRADLLRRALLDGELLRWISPHQGGYPVEFYPLGAAAFEVAVWAATLGLIPMMAAHKIAVIVIFLLPALGFLLLASFDRITIGVGVLALIFHISARGWWWSGGYMELVDWGLVSSFLAMTAVLLFLPLSCRAVRYRSVRWGALAGMVAAFAVYTNARSFLPLAAVAAGMVASLAWEADRKSELPAKLTLSALIVGVAGLLSAPLLISIFRFQDLYFFVIYNQYHSLGEYGRASITAVSGPVFVLAMLGLVTAFVLPNLVAGRLVAFTFMAYVLMTILLSGLTIGPHIEQLEAVRLMPVQRALTIYLAALGIYGAMSMVARWANRYRRAIVELGLLASGIATVLLYVVLGSTPIHASDRALYPVLTTGDSYVFEQQEAVELASARAEVGTAILVLGATLSWHDQFWSFQWSDRPFFFDDWLWYWQRDHFGSYDPTIEHRYPDLSSTLDPEYLRIHGIGAVIASARAANTAAASPLLEQVADLGGYRVYLVNDPTQIITAEGATTTAISIENQRFSADVSAPTTTFEVRRNWFPRWTATVDGHPAAVSKDEHGYMVVTSSTPGTHIEVVYGVDGWDWLGRVLLALGVAVAAGAIVQPRRIERRLGIENAPPYTQGSIGTSMIVGRSRSNAT